MAPMQNITLDMGRRSESRRVVYLGQGDSNGTTLVVSLTEGGRPYDATGMTATMTVPIEGVAINFAGEVTGTTARFAVDESLLGDVSGRFRGAYVTLSSEGSTSSSQRFDVEVYQSFAPAAEPAEDPTDPTDPTDEPGDDPTDEPGGDPTDDPSCGCSEGSLTDGDLDDVFDGE